LQRPEDLGAEGFCELLDDFGDLNVGLEEVCDVNDVVFGVFKRVDATDVPLTLQ
jgi:hypothetical protein